MPDRRLKIHSLRHPVPDVERDTYDREGDDSEVSVQFLVLQGGFELTHDHHIIKPEINAEKKHEYGRDILRRRRVS